MCLIIAKESGVKLPKEEWLDQGFQHNSDGLGLMYWKKGWTEVRIKKDFDNIKQMKSFINENISKDDVLVIHFRLATSGKKDKGNRHPFPITQNKELLREVNVVCQAGVAHNGIINYGDFCDHKKFSDTQKFVLEVLAQPAVKNNLTDEGIQTLVGEFIGTDKLVIITSEGRLIMFGQFIKDEKTYFSNSTYKTYRYVGYTNYYHHRSRYGWDGYETEDYERWNETWNDKRREEEKEKEGKWNEGEKRKCDGCMKDIFCRLTEVIDSKEEFYLCKKCRKAVRRKHLKIETIRKNKYQNIKTQFDLEPNRCHSCLEKTDSLISLNGDFKVCLNCWKAYSDDNNTPEVVSKTDERNENEEVTIE